MKKSSLLGLFLASILAAGISLAENHIIGGTEARDWPWMVSLSDRKNNYNGHFCGGSLISPDWVITAAHCLEGERPDNFHVVVNVHNLKVDAGQKIAVKRIFIHPNYSKKSDDFDIGLVQLKEPVRKAVTLSLIHEDLSLTGILATVIGWGTVKDTKYGSYPAKLQEIQVPIVSNRECRNVYSTKSITDNMLCAGDLSSKKDACQGDSGGPLIIKQSGNWVLAGIVSWGKGCAVRYGVYSRVSKFTDFIEKISLDYSALADVNHDGMVNAADKQAKRDEIQLTMKNYVEQCWTPGAICGDVTDDGQVDWLDLMKESASMENEYNEWLDVVWTPEKT